MARSGLNDFYSHLGLGTGNLKVYYDFSIPSGNVLPSVSNANPTHSGVLDYIGQFHDIEGSGFFTGQSLEVSNFDSINQSRITYLLCFEKTTSQNGILLSTLRSGDVYPSGFAVGVNDVNKLFIESYDTQLGPVVRTSSLPLGRKNAIAITKHNNNNFSVFNYNFGRQELDVEQLDFQFSTLSENTGLTIGNYTDTPSYFEANPFVGYIDHFSVITDLLETRTLATLFSGLVSDGFNSDYQLLNSSQRYSYFNLKSPYRSGMFDSITSGLTEYINDNIFNITGIGSVTALTSGTVVGGVANVSGYIAGTVGFPTGYYEQTTGLVVTGYTYSGRVPTASGITGYQLVNFCPFANILDDIYQVSGYSGLIGPTVYEDVFSGALYGTVTGQRFVSSGLSTNYNIPFSGTLSGLGCDLSYVHSALYSNNGYNQYVISHILDYNSPSVQAETFRINKREVRNYGYLKTPKTIDSGYVDTFNMDGLTFLNLIDEDDHTRAAFHQNHNYRRITNRLGRLDKVRGMFRTDDEFFRTEDVYKSGEVAFYLNGINQFQSGFSVTGIVENDFLLEGDFGLTGNLLIQDKSADGSDDAIIDTFPQIRGVYASGEFLSGDVIPLPYNSNGLYFINGELIEFSDLTNAAGMIQLNSNKYDYISGRIWCSIPSYGNINNYYNVSGEQGFSGLSFMRGTSLVYLNGQRELLGIDYIETASIDALYGSPSQVVGGLEEIYGNSNDFFNE